MSTSLASVTIGTGFTDRDGCIESCREQPNRLLDVNSNMWSEIDPKTTDRIQDILVVQPPKSKKKSSSFGSHSYCGIYSWFVLVDVSNNRFRWRRDLANATFYVQSRMHMSRFAYC